LYFVSNYGQAMASGFLPYTTITPMNFQKNLFILLFFLSGFCNLMYEIVWARMLNLVFGVTVFAVSAVLASFMLGLAIGAIGFGRIVEKVENRIVLFSLLHGGIFISAVVILLVFPWYQDLYLFINKIFHPDFYIMKILLFFLSLVFLIVPTTLMGATFPAAVKIFARQEEHLGKDIGILYSVNTLGSVTGCIITIFFILGAAGMKGTVYIAAGTDLMIGLIALKIRAFSLSGQKSP
jgi:spermidine synthase